MSIANEVDPNHRLPPAEAIDEQRRRFLLISAGVLGSIGAFCALTPLLSSWLPSGKARARGGAVYVDLSKIAPGQQVTVSWRGKPVWIIRRTPQMLSKLLGTEEQLRDPQSLVTQQPLYAQNRHRSINPEYLVLIGLCTHLGCIPKYTPEKKKQRADWPGGFYCPCHGSTFDLAGRVFKGMPAPINLEVPPYRFASKQLIVIGENA